MRCAEGYLCYQEGKNNKKKETKGERCVEKERIKEKNRKEKKKMK